MSRNATVTSFPVCSRFVHRDEFLKIMATIVSVLKCQCLKMIGKNKSLDMSWFQTAIPRSRTRRPKFIHVPTAVSRKIQIFVSER